MPKTAVLSLKPDMPIVEWGGIIPDDCESEEEEVNE